jgi:hypothetical protein
MKTAVRFCTEDAIRDGPGRRFRIKDSDEWNFGGANHVVRDKQRTSEHYARDCVGMARTSGQPGASRKGYSNRRANVMYTPS